jgi:hypothetical protein
MAWIKVIREGEATGRMRQLYDKYMEPNGTVDNILMFQRRFTIRYNSYLTD